MWGDYQPVINKPDIIKEVNKTEVMGSKKSIDGSFVIDDSVVNAKIESIVGTKPFVHGGAIEAAALEAQIIAKGSGVIMAGAGHAKPIKDIKRIISTYGGNENQWAKMTSEELNQKKIFIGGESRQLHWYQNLETGMIVEVKVKSQ